MARAFQKSQWFRFQGDFHYRLHTVICARVHKRVPFNLRRYGEDHPNSVHRSVNFSLVVLLWWWQHQLPPSDWLSSHGGSKENARLFQYLAVCDDAFLLTHSSLWYHKLVSNCWTILFYFAIDLGGCVKFNTSHNREWLLGYYSEHYFANLSWNKGYDEKKDIQNDYYSDWRRRPCNL